MTDQDLSRPPDEVEDEEFEGCCMHGDCALECCDDICHGNACELCEQESDESDDGGDWDD